MSDLVNATYRDRTTGSSAADPAAGIIREYAVTVDANNNSMASKQKVAGAIVEVVDF